MISVGKSKIEREMDGKEWYLHKIEQIKLIFSQTLYHRVDGGDKEVQLEKDTMEWFGKYNI